MVMTAGSTIAHATSNRGTNPIMPGAHSEPLHPSITRRMEEAAYLTAQNVRQ